MSRREGRQDYASNVFVDGALVTAAGVIWREFVNTIVTTAVQYDQDQFTATGDAPSGDVARLRVAPNPFNLATRVRFTLREAGHARIVVYDPRGRQVATLANGPPATGEHALACDCRDHDGRAEPSDIYLLRLEAGGQFF